MAVDFIPRPDNDFDQWEKNLITYVTGHTAALGLVAADLTAVQNEAESWSGDYFGHQTAQLAAGAARQKKDDTRDRFETALRNLVRKVQASSLVTDDQRRAMGITVRDSTPTANTAATLSATRPIGVVDTSMRLRHEIKFFDESTPTSKAKPKGVMGCEILVKIDGTPPLDVSECQMIALDTASPYVAEYGGEQAGKTAYYMFRWVNTRGEKGPVSGTVAATITG